MDNYVLVGKIINTFGIMGEVKIKSSFEYPEKVFISGNILYINNENLEINRHRVHKNNHLVAFKNLNSINDVLKYKNSLVYIKKDELNMKNGEYLLSDLIGFSVYDNDKFIGIVLDYTNNNIQTLFKVKGDKIFYIPNVKEYIRSIDFKNKKIITNKGSELIL